MIVKNAVQILDGVTIAHSLQDIRFQLTGLVEKSDKS